MRENKHAANILDRKVKKNSKFIANPIFILMNSLWEF